MNAGGSDLAICGGALPHEKPNAIVVMLGLNDRLPLREKAPTQPTRNGKSAKGANQSAGQASQDKTASAADAEAPPQTAGQTEPQHSVPGGPFDFHTDQWAALYAKRIDAMIAALKSKGVPVIWVGLPAIRGTKATSDMSYLDELYRERAERAGIIYVDIWDGFVDEDGNYAMQGLDCGRSKSGNGDPNRTTTADRDAIAETIATLDGRPIAALTSLLGAVRTHAIAA